MNRGSELAEDLMLEILPTLEIPAEVAAEAAHPPRAPKGSQGQHTQPWENAAEGGGISRQRHRHPYPSRERLMKQRGRRGGGRSTSGGKRRGGRASEGSHPLTRMMLIYLY
jgi:hypothetical protein